jgi:4-hydroxy-tetrahydrodipicolinate reductase
MIRVIIAGPRGRMGGQITALAQADPEIEIVAVLDSKPVAGSADAVPVIKSLTELKSDSLKGAVLIDFTTPEATLAHASECAAAGVAMVVGTTGFEGEQRAHVERVSSQIPLLIAANTSLGVTVLLDVVKRLAAVLPEYDIEIVESHHNRKKDSPSGTALAFAEAAAAGRKVKLDDVRIDGRTGLIGERPKGEIAIHSVRAGDIVGEHAIYFAGLGERVEVIHRASSRQTFAVGALTAAKFLAKSKPGLYRMADVLGI